MSKVRLAMTEGDTLYLLRRQCGGSGGAEKVVRRFRQVLGEGRKVLLLSAGEKVEDETIGGAHGPSWWRAWRYTVSVERLLRYCDGGGRVLSFERGPRCDVYRAGDGVHRRWVELKYGGSLRGVFNLYHWVAPRLERRTMESARWIVANSRMVAGDIARYYPEFREKVRVIYNGYDAAVYRVDEGDRGALRERLDLPREGRVLLFAGGGWERKGLEYAIQFLSELEEKPAPFLVVAGKGRRKYYRQKAEDLGVFGRVHFAGVVDDMAAYYQAADLHILPTLYDPFSNSCLEALACGCPVLTTGRNGAAEVIRPGETGHVLGSVTSAADWSEARGWWAGFEADRAVIARSVRHLTSEAELKQYARLLSPGADVGLEEAV